MVIRWKYAKMMISVVIVGLLVMTGTGCRRDQTVDINVSAASSLTQVISEIVNQYTQANKDVKINLNFAGTNTLKMQIEEGVDVDLFLSANFKYYDELDKKGYIEEGAEFAKNKLCIIKHKDNKNIYEIQDITKSGLKVITGNEDVPIGKYTLEVLNKLNEKYGADFSEKVQANVVSKETNVKRIVTKINLNEGDVGFVYKTDITDSVKENVESIEIEDQYNVMSHYYAGIVIKEKIKEETKKLYQYLFSTKGQEILKSHGFIVEEKE